MAVPGLRKKREAACLSGRSISVALIMLGGRWALGERRARNGSGAVRSDSELFEPAELPALFRVSGLGLLLRDDLPLSDGAWLPCSEAVSTTRLKPW